MSRPIVGTGLASCCTILSVVGVIFLSLLGLAFNSNVEVLTRSTKFTSDGPTVARNCFIAAMIYAGFILLCSCQISMNKRYARGTVRL